MDPRDKLKEARVAASQGRYADALRAHIWFHEKAVEHEPSLYGVRLSFALGDWIDLGSKYPEALRSLETIRDSKTAALIDGPRRRDLFHDVAAINRSLGVTDRTYELFHRLCDIDGDFARSCSSIAMPAIVDAQDYSLAARFMPDPEARVRALSRQLNEDVRRLRDPNRATRHLDQKLTSYAHVYADEVGLIVTVLVGVGQAAEASMLRDLAINCVEVDSVRDSVCDLLPSDRGHG